MSDDAPLAKDHPFIQAFTTAIPHVVELGIETEEAADGVAIMRLPYQARFAVDPESGVLAGGVVTTLIDSVCGIAVITALRERRRIATIDLRIDYLRPATPNEDLLAKAECYKVTKQVAFVRCVAYQQDENDLVASSQGTFMIHRLGRGQNKKNQGGGGA